MKNYLQKLIVLFLFASASAFAQIDEETKARNERIRQRWNRSLVDNQNYIFNKDANNLLAQTASSINPGSALCVAMGQGRNALYLAKKGWVVSGFDLADEALAYAQKEAKQNNLSLHTEIASFDTYSYGSSKWDLITWLYGGCLQIEGIVPKLREALVPGGLFVFEFFHRDAGVEMGRSDFGCEENSIKQMFEEAGGFQVLLYEEKEGIADYGMKPNKLIYMVVSKL
ncbi:class I SAM-dependent methyltransferase [Eudoraea chungangensis]|uniref:class I SAM-dependent methyltransferase n=1 Tax=Eudoraea chungangensis TaxID=1481905 RepID=UPI0023EBAB37|nr:class I SAM-dependent methyltransferase [Eudoraea chungangensis]